MDLKKQGIEFCQATDYETLSQFSAQCMLEVVRKKQDALLCIATGSSPERAYEIFVDTVHKEQIDVSRLRILKLDEWWRVVPEDHATCEYFIQTKLLQPLGISPENYMGFHSDANDPEADCRRVAQWLNAQGPIDLCILGIGKNGHLGLNEPDAYFTPGPHVVTLQEKTKTHSMLTQTHTPIDKGMTLGMADILASGQILLIVTGDEKLDAFRGFLKGQVRSDLPVSILWLHSNTQCVMDISFSARMD